MCVKVKKKNRQTNKDEYIEDRQTKLSLMHIVSDSKNSACHYWTLYTL